jgi:anthranilate synthase component 1
MQLSPAQPQFDAARAQSKAQLVWTKLVSDLETPVSAMLKLKDDTQPSFLLESVEGGETRGRYSIIGLAPDQLWRCRGNKPEISKKPPFAEDSFELCWEDALSSLKTQARAMELDIPEELPPMAAGIIGFMAYDMVKLMERLPDENPDPIGIPDSCFMRPTLVLVFDSVDGVVYIIAPVWKDREVSYAQVQAQIDAAVRKLQGPIDQRHYVTDAPSETVDFKSNMTRDDFQKMVNTVKEYIVAGDIFQGVGSQRFEAEFKHSPFAMYRSLRQLNPSPFLFYLHFGDFTLVGSSPEILVRVRDDTVTIRPIAGTRPRGKDKAEDAALEAELLADSKECAEHLMLLDLGRNDVGRVCTANSVHVTEHMSVEHYSHVMHIVSNVEGTLDRSRYDAIDALIAGFPAGTVSGAPKIRAMEIIDEVEPHRRSFYAGGTGYISANGSLDMCINLRTCLIKDGKIYAQAGGGIVADSDPEGEYQESLNKAKAVMRAAENAGRFGG